MNTGRALAIAGCKGGVGKSTTAINLGAAASSAGLAVLLVETDLAMANVADFVKLGFNAEADPSLHDVLAGETPIENAIYEASDGIAVLPSGVTLDGFAKTDLNRLSQAMASISDDFDLILFDTPAGISREVLVPMALADGVILVATPRVSAIRDVKKTAELAERVGGRNVGMILTHTGTGTAPPGERLADFVGATLLGEVPEDDAVPSSQDAGQAVTSFAPDSPAARAYSHIADSLGLTEPDRTKTSTSPSN